MAKIEFDSILRCANVNCVHNRDGYNCTCNVITLNADGQCALVQPKPKYEGITVNYRKADGGNPVESVPTPLSKLVPPLD